MLSGTRLFIGGLEHSSLIRGIQATHLLVVMWPDDDDDDDAVFL